MELIDNLIEQGWLKTPNIIQAFKKIKRVDFLPRDSKNLAELNEALPLGYNQTISQPLVVAFMLEQLKPELNDKILDVGSGSGWTSALLGEIVGLKGKVIALETIKEIKEFGEKNAARYHGGQVQFILADGSKGYAKEAPFDRILASAAVQEEIPQAWKEQLKIGGRIVTPVGSSIFVLIKKSEKEFTETEYPGFAFVPLIEGR
ncbi:MAG: protein-L-isoaspartate O-methyltransferase [Candidatus Nealsonbacteria bacterium RIFCSPLOWO2_01_FULL_43_32]|uniref:Protein-L-isoaspartate O-methyltransferase n=1 Tax=Candidatus Nealsonbacteria bacterium RIFCSPLOWO2_01_FULL_43_32 TaxID=1801672 RepID=A0A1G2EH21_9BACT|nr:MAG: protein-L-isoaspartate O-methyltransferase [Candidatus Nealsonbacteria bacterium RIFCSPLOWO2_01_FULL_43_32]